MRQHKQKKNLWIFMPRKLDGTSTLQEWLDEPCFNHRQFSKRHHVELQSTEFCAVVQDDRRGRMYLLILGKIRRLYGIHVSAQLPQQCRKSNLESDGSLSRSEAYDKYIPSISLSFVSY